MDVYTIQIWRARQLGLDNSPAFLDITVKSGDPAFAPTWDMVMGHKRGVVSDDAYTKEYERMMDASVVSNKERWIGVLFQDEVILACYCKPGKFCHRYLLADILVRLGATYRGEITFLR